MSSAHPTSAGLSTMNKPFDFKEWRWPLFTVAAIPGLFGVIALLALRIRGTTWRSQWSGGAFLMLQMALVPLYIALGPIVAHWWRTRPSGEPSHIPSRPQPPLWPAGAALSVCFMLGAGAVHNVVGDLIHRASRHVDRVDATCSNSVRDIVMGTTTTKEVVIFDRYCRATPNKHTVNVSILAPGSEIDGPGNVFVGEEFPSPPGGPQGVSTFASPEGPFRVHVMYAPTVHVLERREKFGEITVDFMADTLPDTLRR
jgi:hypothetical protein